MSNTRELAAKILGDKKLQEVDNAGLIIEKRTDRDRLRAELNSLKSQMADLKSKVDQYRRNSDTNAKIAAMVGSDEVSTAERTRQILNVLAPFARLNSGEYPDINDLAAARSIVCPDEVSALYENKQIPAVRKISLEDNSKDAITKAGKASEVNTSRNYRRIIRKPVPNVVKKKRPGEI